MKKFLSVAMLTGVTMTGSTWADDAIPASQATNIVEQLSETLKLVQKTEKGSWLGVSASHGEAVLLKQLKQKSGLVVDSVEPKSPAEQAGLKAYDLLIKLDDQLLINPQQLQELIRQHEPGQSITLTLLREGEEMKVTASLVEHDVPELSDADRSGDGFQYQTFVKAADGGPLRELPFGDNQRIAVMTQDGAVLNSNIVFKKNGRQYILSSRDGKKHLLVRDAGRELFSGPVQTSGDEDKVPAELQADYKEMQKVEKIPEIQNDGK